MDRKVRPALWVVCGCMFSGKTEELIRLLRREEVAGEVIQVFKPRVDDRYGISRVSTHNGEFIEAVAIQKERQITESLNPETTVVGIDEAQFFSDGLLEEVGKLLDKNLKVIVAGLNLDFRGEPFGVMERLICSADQIVNLHAICAVCKADASRTQRFVNGQPARYDEAQFLVGAKGTYEARCREHHIVPR